MNGVRGARNEEETELLQLVAARRNANVRRSGVDTSCRRCTPTVHSNSTVCCAWTYMMLCAALVALRRTVELAMMASDAVCDTSCVESRRVGQKGENIQNVTVKKFRVRRKHIF